jgi:alpha-beta hydrolase superfamily lysophospholipase
VAQLVDLAREGLPENGRVHLMGHSLGGLIALLFALTRPDNLAAVAASSPALGPAIKLPPIKESMGRLMSVCWPTLTLANEIDAGVLSHDPRTVAGYRSDPLVHDRVSARLYTEILAGMTRAPQMAARMALPVLIQAAGEDRLVSVPRTRDFFAALPSGDKTLLVYDGLFHEIYNEAEPDRERTLTDLTHWLETRMAAPGADRRPWDGR